ncbi:unnamed protein product [Cylicostephanus goldi]|uniref:Uncharacterized protein n=1 Tax=Cylicostephanus goldi TaxID=71465 RepID=A0A3P7M4D5_CYLGO|nr:unnamed protein product [Cylicostephanus goldi]
MVQAGGHRRPWAEAASSVFAVASALPSTMNSEQIADLFEKIESGVAIDPFPQLPADIKRNAGHFDVVKILLEAGASVDLPDMMGWSPLMWAVYKCHPEVVDLLLNYGAHVNLIDEEDGLTPLIVASGRGFTSVVEKLLAADAQYRFDMGC